MNNRLRGDAEHDSIKMAERYEPPLKSGKYTVEVNQTTNIGECIIESEQFAFSCEPDAFELKRGEIYSVYPPENSFGLFDTVLPHVVFARRTLPWERPVSFDSKAPWLALLLFDENDGVIFQSMARREAFSDTHTQGVYCPVVPGDNPDEFCTVLDVKQELFCDVCPSLPDLKLTAHARCVKRDKKAIESENVDEWLSVLVGNRLPGASADGVKNTAYIVAIDAFGEFFNNRGVVGSYTLVRVPVLSSWSFYSTRQEHSFKTLFSELDVAPLSMPEVQNLPLPELFQRGFVPLNHALRDGGQTVSWYRGPLLPCEVIYEEATAQYSADARLVYDPELSMFDITYAAAFMLGRFLAMQSNGFMEALDYWRTKNKRNAHKRISQLELASALGGKSADKADKTDKIESIIDSRAEHIALEVMRRLSETN